jgi:hypothetical protein
MPNIVVSGLAADMNQNVERINELFNLKMKTMDQVKRDFVVRGINQKLRMIRKVVGNISQPSFKDNAENFSANLLELKQREVTLENAKFDMQFGEAELEDLTHGLFQELDPATPGDVLSLAGQDIILDAIFTRLDEEVAATPYKGVRGVTASLNGGLNLADGLAVKFTAAIAGGTEMTGAANSLYATTGAVAFTSANILGEIKAYRDKLLANKALTRSIRSEGYRIHINPSILVLAMDAQDAALSNYDSVITKNAAGNYVLKGLEKAEFIPSDWMDAVTDNWFGTLPDNLYYVYGIGAEKAKLIVEARGRQLVMLGDFKLAFDFADPRSIVLYKGYGL